MSFVDMQQSMPTPSSIKTESARSAPVWRLPLLGLLMAIGITWNIYLQITAPVADSPSLFAFTVAWYGSFVPYIIACIVVLYTPAQTGRQRWIELACIFVGAFVLRALFVPVDPNSSRDAWRYLWDARVTLHGFSPYVYVPGDPALIHLRNFLFENSRYRNVPTLYPPAAQAVYLLSYLLAPDSMVMFKSILIVFEIVTCAGLVIVLRAYGMDMSRCLIYAWCPLPIFEFAMQGHHEAITITFTVLALVWSLGKWRGSGILTGLFIALATLTNVYPLLLLLVVIYRRNRSWLFSCMITCIATIILAYIPYIILGQGRVLGFFGTFASEQSANAGPVLLFGRWIGVQLHLGSTQKLLLGYAVDLLVVGCVALAVIWLRWRDRIRPEDAILLLIVTIFAASTHINPWYNTALLPWVVFMVGPIWTRQHGWNVRGWVGLAAWFFACSVVSWYIHFFAYAPKSYLLSEGMYYIIVYDLPLLMLLLAVCVSWRQGHTRIDLQMTESEKNVINR
jgi:hypothetical protein